MTSGFVVKIIIGEGEVNLYHQMLSQIVRPLAIWLVSVIRIFPAPAGTGVVCSSSPQKHLLGLGVDGPRGDGAWNWECRVCTGSVCNVFISVCFCVGRVLSICMCVHEGGNACMYLCVSACLCLYKIR